MPTWKIESSAKVPSDQKIKEKVLKGWFDFKEAPDRIKDDKETVLTVVGKRGSLLKHASSRLKNDLDVVRKAMNQDVESFQYADPSIKNNKSLVLSAFRGHIPFQLIPEAMRNDKDVILAAIKSSSSNLAFVPEEYRNNRELVLKALEKDGKAIYVIPEGFRNEKAFLMASFLYDNFLSFTCVPNHLVKDKEIVLVAVSVRFALNLQYVGDEFQDDEEVVLESVKHNGLSLQYASKRLQGDPIIVEEAMKENPFAFKFASVKLQGNEEFIKRTIPTSHNVSCHYLQFVSKDLLKKKEFVLSIITRYPFIFQYVSEKLQDDEEVVLEALEWQATREEWLENKSSLLEYASDRILNNREFLLDNYEVTKFGDTFIQDGQISLELNLLVWHEDDFDENDDTV